MMLRKIQECFRIEQVYYTKHARDEMEDEDFGEIKDDEVFEAVSTGKIIESYPDDEPYPSCLIYGRTSENRPLHVLCAHSDDDGFVVIVTAYQPHPERWIDFARRRR
jgi:hypothetical protein